MELRLVEAMNGMEGEHDEYVVVPLENRGGGVYTGRMTATQPEYVLTGMSLKIQRGGQPAAFALEKSDFGQ
ncbi:MAG: hypothetical protein HZB53_19885 [Chloroflexi bacterium]|nr:hypothetical protein [Chloroflexota bacterium]